MQCRRQQRQYAADNKESPGELAITSLDRRDYLNLLGLCLLAGIIRFYGLGGASFWADEIFTLKFSSLPWSTLWVSAYDATPPLYFSIIHLMLGVGEGEGWLRLPSALAGVMTIVFVYLAVVKLAGSRAALATGLLLTVSIANIEYSQEARAYALACMWIAMSFLGLAALSERWADDAAGVGFRALLAGGGAVYGIGLLAGLYSHNLAVFYWLAAQFFFLGWWLSTFRFSRGLLTSWFVLNLLVLILWLPWLRASLQFIEQGRWVWLEQYDFGRALQTWRRVNGIETGYSLDALIDWLVIALTAWGLFCLRKRMTIALTLLAMLLFSSLVMWLYGFVAEPVFMRRSVLWGSLFSLMLVGIGISHLPPLVGRVVLIGLFGAGLVGSFNYHRYGWAENDDWRSPAQLFAEQAGADDVLLFRTTWQAPAFLHYLDQPQVRRRVLGWSCTTQQPLFGQVHARQHFSRVAWSEQNPGWDDTTLTAATVWVVHNECPDAAGIEASDSFLQQHWTQVSSHGFKGVVLNRWVPRQAVLE